MFAIGLRPRPAARTFGLLVGVIALVASVSGPAFTPDAPAGPVRPAALFVTVIQPDPTNGTDAFILDITRGANYGDNGSLLVGRNAAEGSLARSLLRFNLSAIPAGATIVSASLEARQVSGGAGSVQVRRVLSPWEEGFGANEWTRIPVTVRETAGVARTLEPVEITLPFAPYTIAVPERDLTVYSGGIPVPAQVYALTAAGGQITSAKVVFGVSVGPMATRTFDIHFSRNGSGVPAYRTKTWNPGSLWNWSAGTGSSGASIVDLDRDGALDVIIGGQNGILYALTGTGTQKWATQLSATRAIPYAPQVRDMDNDGALDIVVFQNEPEVFRLNDAGGIVWRNPFVLGSIPFGPPALVDVNADGVLDVVFTGRAGNAQALDGRDGTLIRTYAAGDWTYPLAVADADRNGVPEIFFASDDGFVRSYDVTGTLRWATSPPAATWLENSVAIGDVDGDGTLEVVTTDESQASEVYSFNAVTGNLDWSVPLTISSWREGGQTLADLNGDGSLEVLVPTESTGLYALRGSDGTVLWRYTDSAFQPLHPAVVDLNKDGSVDIAYVEEGSGGAAALRVLDRNGTLIQQWNVARNVPGFRGYQFALYTPAIADLDGDGTLEIAIPTGIGLEVFGTGGLARDWRTWGYNWNHTHRAFDGNSPNGAPFLQATVGAAQTMPAPGVSWAYRDGVATWATSGGDLGGVESTSAASPGLVSWNVTAAVQGWFAGAIPNVGLALTEANEATGPIHSFASSDQADPALRPRLRITYDAPLLDPVPRITAPIPNLVHLEDETPWSLLLSGLTRDDDTPLSGLRWNVSGFDPAIVTISGLEIPGNHLLTFYPQPNAWGNMRVTYWLTDTDGNWARQDAWVNLTEVNDPPTCSPPGILLVRHDEPYTFDFSPYVTDIDDPLGQLTLATDDPTRALVSGLNVTFLYPQSLLDQWVFVTLTVSDGEDTTARVIAIKVTTDRPPVLNIDLPDVTMFEGERKVGVFDLDDHFTDPDNDVLFFSEGYSHLNITIHANHSVDIEAEPNWFGWERVTFRGQDPTGAIAEDTIIVTILPIDDPPTIGNVPDLVVRFDEPYTFDLTPYVDDPDTAPGALAITTSSAFVSVSGRVMTLLYPAAMNGSFEDVIVTVDDGTTSVSATFRVSVGDDYPPILLGRLSDTSFLEDETRLGVYDLSTFFSDPDSATLFYSSGNDSVSVTISGGGSVDLAGAANWSGQERITFRATDAVGALAEDTVEVIVLPVNDAPSFANLPEFVVNSTTAYVDLAAYLRDIDTPLASLTLATSNSRARIVGQGLLLNFDGAGTQVILVELSDGEFSVVRAVTVTVVLTVPPAIPQLPGWVMFLPFAIGGAGFTVFVLYRKRTIEWVFLVTNVGILVSSVSRADPTSLDTDIVTGMLTAIMDFAKRSFSDEQERELTGLSLGDQKVAIVRGDIVYLAAVYKGRTPGTLLGIMKDLVTYIESHHRAALGDIIDTSTLGEIPALLQKLVEEGWSPFLRFPNNGRGPKRGSPAKSA